jgi:DNA-binding NarL/FixJ family response regulator
MISIVLVEDQAMLRDSLACTINAQDDMEVVASLSDAADALAVTKRTGLPARFSISVPRTTRAASWRHA